jgi:DNA-binding transcriptional regulator YhcF (GntR family)
MAQVTRLIMPGQLAAGTQLASVASLAGRVRVNPVTISKACSFVVEVELVERRPGAGLFVLRVRQDREARLRDSLLEEAMVRGAGHIVGLIGANADTALLLLISLAAWSPFAVQFFNVCFRKDLV